LLILKLYLEKFPNSSFGSDIRSTPLHVINRVLPCERVLNIPQFLYAYPVCVSHVHVSLELLLAVFIQLSTPHHEVYECVSYYNDYLVLRRNVIPAQAKTDTSHPMYCSQVTCAAFLLPQFTALHPQWGDLPDASTPNLSSDRCCVDVGRDSTDR
jgi:hypothetical protein